MSIKDYNIDLNSLHNLIIGDYVNDDDIIRWFSQEFIFSYPNFTLKQGHGGPCGILAVVQAEIIKNLYFEEENNINNNNQDNNNNDNQDIELLNITEDKQINSFSKALWNILWRSKSQNCVYLVYSIETISNVTECLNLPVLEFYSESMFLDSFPNFYLPYYTSGSGCFLFLLSLILTRGHSVIKRDMDDSNSSLLGQYGHCTQELMNLLIIGEAVSNVFDGNLKMDETSNDPSSLMLKGVSHQCDIGYLTQLEALRYCQVGSYLKYPKYPIWVIGSSSHFTVLFSLNRDINKQSDEEQLFSKVQREFKAIDTHECGFITEDKLQLLLLRLSVSFASNNIDVNRFSYHIRIDGGIILWSTFWQNISKILTGTSLDSLLNQNQNQNSSNSSNSLNQNSSNQQIVQRLRSDSEVARELQASFDNNYNSNIRQQIGLIRSDSEIARQLQDEWNNEESVVTSPQNNNNNRSTNTNTTPVASTPNTSFNNNSNNDNIHLTPPRSNTTNTNINSSDISSPSNSLKRHRSDSIATKDDENFICYHYNGFDSLSNINENNILEQSNTILSSTNNTIENNSKSLLKKKLTKFKLYRRSTDNNIGQSIGFTTGNIIFADSGISKLEEVLRTRWIGCRIDFLGNPVPVID